MQVNNQGKEVVEEIIIFPAQLSEYQTTILVTLLLEHLKLRAVWTNATKHGHFEMELRNEPQD